MRQIKFRVWDTIEKKYYYWGFGIGSAEFVGPPNDYTGRFIHEEFTSLKDKNGKEIYEGDIVEETYEGKKRIFEVAYSAPQFVFQTKQGSQSIYIYTNCILRVLGNVWENPEFRL